jgi:hypothetical protein
VNFSPSPLMLSSLLVVTSNRSTTRPIVQP